MKSKKINKKDCANTPFYASERGITLVALAVTIIVLVILTGITIGSSIKDEGVIKQAQDTEEKDQIAKLEEKLELWRGNNDLANFTGANVETPLEFIIRLVEEEIITLKDVEGFTIKIGSYEVDLKKEDTYKNADEYNDEQIDEYFAYIADYINGVPIPKGFEAVEKSKGIYYKEEEGIVIRNIADGNEFVWVPVPDITKFARLKTGTTDYRSVLYSAPNSEMSYPNLRTEPAVVTGVTDGTGTSYDGAEANRVEILDEGYENSTAGLLKQFQTEFNKMVESVKKYGGFYVGRYETSNGNESKPNSQINKTDWYTHYERQKELYSEDSDSVVSAMIYGCQWDATMNWMTQEPNPTVTGAFYVSNSTNMGWYRENGSYNPNNLTGFDYAGVYNKVRNIYDLAGLNYEFTQEACDTDKRTWRGGFITGYGNERPAFHRSMHYPSGDESCYGSSRLQLYIKTK